MFFKVVKAGLKNPSHKKYFEQIIATLNFMSFKKLMVKRNKELELEALQMLQNEGVVGDAEVQQASLNKDQAELEHAIAVSIAAEAERKRIEEQEEEMLKQILELSANEYKAQIEAQKAEEVKAIMQMQRKKAEKIASMEENQKIAYENQKKAEAEARLREEEEYKRQEEIRNQNKQLEEQTRKRLEEENKRIESKRKEDQKAEEVRQKARKIEEEVKKKKSEETLGPIIVKKTQNVDLSEFKRLDITKELEESSKLEEMNKNIADKYNIKKEEVKVESGVESLEERTNRLKKQREMLLKKKQAERDTEMQDYLSKGGTDLSVKKDLGKLPSLISPEELEKRRDIINKIKALD